MQFINIFIPAQMTDILKNRCIILIIILYDYQK
jgi:hypothetical protein